MVLFSPLLWLAPRDDDPGGGRALAGEMYCEL